jgi:hypothetical protein
LLTAIQESETDQWKRHGYCKRDCRESVQWLIAKHTLDQSRLRCSCFSAAVFFHVALQAFAAATSHHT